MDRIRKGAKPHVYLREWRKAKRLRAVAMAERIEVERESYYRLEREPHTLSVGEIVELAYYIGVEPSALFHPPPPELDKPAPPSVDNIIRDMPEDDQKAVLDMAQRLQRRAAH